jgi:predicted RNA polymerase sigma factor
MRSPVPLSSPSPLSRNGSSGPNGRWLSVTFNEGYSPTAGADWVRPALCEDALRLGRVLAEPKSKEPEVHGLVALMELQASRSRARVGPDGERSCS